LVLSLSGVSVGLLDEMLTVCLTVWKSLYRNSQTRDSALSFIKNLLLQYPAGFLGDEHVIFPLTHCFPIFTMLNTDSSPLMIEMHMKNAAECTRLDSFLFRLIYRVFYFLDLSTPVFLRLCLASTIRFRLFSPVPLYHPVRIIRVMCQE
jgi:hypothetical protein